MTASQVIVLTVKSSILLHNHEKITESLLQDCICSSLYTILIYMYHSFYTHFLQD